MLALAWLSLLIWLFLLFGRGQFWRVSKFFASASVRPIKPCRIVAIIPARNEADVIEEALTSLLHQEFEGDLQIIVVDDNSTDGTGNLARSAGVTVLTGAPLPSGWTGKLWAMNQGVATAVELKPDFLLFTDADIRHDAHNVSSLVGMAQTFEIDLVSHMVKLHCTTWAEKFTIPAFVFFFFKLYPPSLVASGRSATAGAAGGCILIRPAILQKIGGLDSIRSEVIDDCSLAARVKQAGGRLLLGLTRTTTSIRPYEGLLDIGKMISRSAFRELDHSVLLLVGALAGLTLTYLVPPWLALHGSCIAFSAWLLMTLCYLPMVRFYRLNPFWAFTLPLTACFYLGATIHSAITYWSGRGGQWKGRAQDPPT